MLSLTNLSSSISTKISNTVELLPNTLYPRVRCGAQRREMMISWPILLASAKGIFIFENGVEVPSCLDTVAHPYEKQ